MNYEISSENLSTRNLEFDGCHELALDMDFSLPDYCPDIQRVLKCQVCPNITARNISGDRLNIEGVFIVKVLYVDAENMKIRCCENQSPFSASIDIKGAPADAIAITSTKVEYINCRAISPRKVDIHGAVSLCAKIYNKKNIKIPCCINGKGIEQKIENKEASDLIGIGQQQFSINETLQPESNLPEPEMIIRSDACVILNDYKTMPNKIVVKGEVMLKILYISDISTNNIETMRCSIPVSQIVDVPGANENSHYVITGEILSHDEQLHSEGEKNMISADIKISATVMVYQNKDIALVSDAYSTNYNLETETDFADLTQLAKTIEQPVICQSTLDISGTNASKIIDIWCDFCSATATCKMGKALFKIKTNVCILGLDAENTPFYLERLVESTHDVENENVNENLTTETNIVPVSISHSAPADNKLDIKVNLNISAELYNNQKCSVIKNASADETAPIVKDEKAALIIYYANGGESIWNIARKYHTCVSAVKYENGLEEDNIQQNGMLLIPVN